MQYCNSSLTITLNVSIFLKKPFKGIMFSFLWSWITVATVPANVRKETTPNMSVSRENDFHIFIHYIKVDLIGMEIKM